MGDEGAERREQDGERIGGIKSRAVGERNEGHGIKAESEQREQSEGRTR